jgi:hypothetical protein
MSKLFTVNCPVHTQIAYGLPKYFNKILPDLGCYVFTLDMDLKNREMSLFLNDEF